MHSAEEGVHMHQFSEFYGKILITRDQELNVEEEDLLGHRHNAKT